MREFEAAAMANASGYHSTKFATVFASFCGCVSEFIIARILRAGLVPVYGVKPYRG